MRESVPWEDVFARFIAHIEAEGKADATIRDYHKRVGKFVSSIPRDADEEALRETVLTHLARLRDKAPATYNRTLEDLRAFFSWCVREGYAASDPTRGIRRRKDEGRVRALPEDVVKRLLTLPDRSTWAGARDYVFILLALDTGIRSSEALRLLPADVDLARGEILVRAEVAKTRRARVLPISPPTVKAIRELLAARPEEWGDVPVLCSELGKDLPTASLDARFARYSRRLGVKVRPYDLRHTFATEFLRRGGDPLTLRLILGHATFAMTQRYVALASSDVKERHREAGVLGRFVEGRRGRRIRRI